MLVGDDGDEGEEVEKKEEGGVLVSGTRGGDTCSGSLPVPVCWKL